MMNPSCNTAINTAINTNASKPAGDTPLLQRRRVLGLLLPSLALAACGGGGSSDSGSAAAPNPQPPVGSPLPVPAPVAAPAPAPAPQAPASGTGPEPVSRWVQMSAPSTSQAIGLGMPAVALAPSGAGLMAWVQTEGLAPQVARVRACLCAPDGSEWSTPVVLNEGDTGSVLMGQSNLDWNLQPNPTLAVWHGATGDASVYWVRTENFSNAQLRSRTWRAASGTWEPAKQYEGTGFHGLRAATSAAGHVAVWRLVPALPDGITSIITVIAPDGSETIHTRRQQGIFPQRMVVDDRGTVTVSWWDSGRIWLAQTGSSTWLTPAEVGRSRYAAKLFMDMAVAPDGEVLLAWSADDYSVGALLLRSVSEFRFLPRLRVYNASGLPSVCRTPGGWALGFVASIDEDRFFSQDINKNVSYFCRLQDGATEWSGLMALSQREGLLQLRGREDGSISVLAKGLNVNAYGFDPAISDWRFEARIAFGSAPAVSASARSQRMLAGWTEGNQLVTWLRR